MLDDGVSDEAGYVAWVDGLDFEKKIAEPFLAFVSRDLRTWPFFKHILWNWAMPRFRARDLERRYAKRITKKRALGEIPAVPEFVFCATDLTFGVNWEFRRDRSGSYQAGYLNSTKWPVARAVAASACFPPLFGPMRINADPSEFKKKGYREQDGNRLRKKLDLSDGGVYDNMGLEPAWKDADNVLVSDCGAPFAFQSGGTFLRRLMRYTSVVTNQALNDVISRIRTDLDAFVQSEFAVLVNHGYAQSNAAVREHLPDLVSHDQPAALPYPEWSDEDEVRKALSTSHKRLSVKRLIQRFRDARERRKREETS